MSECVSLSAYVRESYHVARGLQKSTAAQHTRGEPRNPDFSHPEQTSANDRSKVRAFNNTLRVVVFIENYSGYNL